MSHRAERHGDPRPCCGNRIRSRHARLASETALPFCHWVESTRRHTAVERSKPPRDLAPTDGAEKALRRVLSTQRRDRIPPRRPRRRHVRGAGRLDTRSCKRLHVVSQPSRRRRRSQQRTRLAETRPESQCAHDRHDDVPSGEQAEGTRLVTGDMTRPRLLRSASLTLISAGLIGLAARGARLAAFDGRCIPAGCVAPRSHAPGRLGRRALPAGRLARLGATPDVHHGLLGPRIEPRRSAGIDVPAIDDQTEKTASRHESPAGGGSGNPVLTPAGELAFPDDNSANLGS